jgi:hypothetical protein
MKAPLFHTGQIQHTRSPPRLNVEGSNGSKPDDILLKHVMEKIDILRQEFEELLFLKYAAETLKDFRKRLLQEKWD